MTNPVVVPIGVGLDTARYGHHASFLREDRQPAAEPFTFQECRSGYEKFEAALRQLAAKHQHRGEVHFHIRIDAAGQYAVNLEAFVRQLDFPTTISIGQPKANKDYKSVHYPKRKADAVESLACARFAVVERPAATPETPVAFAQLRDLASALAGQRQHTTSHLNRLHNHLARVFPELALLAANLAADWVLTLLAKYPTPARIAAARADSLTRIPHVDAERAAQLQAAARHSTGSLHGPLAETLVRELVTAVRQSQQAEQRLFGLLEEGYDALPLGGHRQLLSIPGIGKRTAAALTAKIVAIDRFPTPEALVSYFGAFPEENSSGVDKRGNPIPKGTLQMSSKGNDLVRGLLWMAAQSAIQCNPAVRALYLRQRARGKRGDVALGHCLRKLLHLVYAVWKTDQPFDPLHYAWEPAAAAEPTAPVPTAPAAPVSEPAALPVNATQPVATTELVNATEPAVEKSAAGRKGQRPERKAVTAAANELATRTIPAAAPDAKGPGASGAAKHPVPKGSARVDFAQLRRQVSMTDVLQKLGWLDRLGGRGAQRRGPCPIHEPAQASGRCFSVNLSKQVFRCLHPDCAAQGNVLDLWAAVQRLPLRDAAMHLAATFNLPCPQSQTTTPETRS